MFNHLETQLRSLDTLSVTSNIYACTLVTLVVSGLPEPILTVWHRQQLSRFSLVEVKYSANGEDTPETQKHKLEEL